MFSEVWGKLCSTKPTDRLLTIWKCSNIEDVLKKKLSFYIQLNVIIDTVPQSR